MSTCVQLPDDSGLYFGAGRIDAKVALEAASGVEPPPPLPPPEPPEPPPPPRPEIRPVCFVWDIGLAVERAGKNWRVCGEVVVLRNDGFDLPGATVTAQWSGLVNGTASAVTDAAGIATFRSPPTKRKGSVTLRIVSVTYPGIEYRASLNEESEATIQVP